MGMIDDFKAQNPDYQGVDNDALSDALYGKYYSSMPRDAYDAKVGGKPSPVAQSVMTGDNPYANEDVQPSQNEMMKGAPVLGALAPQDARTQQLEKEHPGASALLRTIGSVTSTAPAMLAAPEAFGLAGPLGQRLAMGGMVNGAVGATDSAARGGSLSDIERAGGISALAGMVPSVISPGLGAKTAETIADKVLPAGATALGVADAFHQGSIMPAFEGMIASTVGLNPHVSGAIKGYLSNNMIERLATLLSSRGAKPVADAAAETAEQSAPEADALTRAAFRTKNQPGAPFAGKIDAQDLAKVLQGRYPWNQ